MPHQVALTVVAPVRPDAGPALEAALASASVPFERLSGVHFARVFTLLADVAADGSPTSQKLVLMSDVDAPLDRHVGELAEIAGPALDPLFAHCEGYPDTVDAAARRTFLERHSLEAGAFYVNTVGRGLDQVLLEKRLREAIEAELDRRRDELAGLDAVAVRERIRRFVEADPHLRPALRPAASPEQGFRFGEAMHAVLVPLVLILLLPVVLVLLVIGAVLLRYHETRDVPGDQTADPAHVERLAELEDHSIQNPFIAAGPLKPGPFRRTLTTVVLFFASYATRHVFNNANLAGVKTIHFARWVFLDNKGRVVFASNYDGSVESYMDDFIDKVWWGLNAVFSNGVGYPRVRWLFFGGARDERAFKRILRFRQEPVQVWYSAYPDMTARNLENNQRLRAGLSGEMNEAQAARWLERL